MGQYTSNTNVAVYPFTRQPDDNEVVIGRADTSTFLVLPHDAIELLDDLSDGKTIGEAQLIYQQKYGELPDLIELLEYLELKGFVQPIAPAHIHHLTWQGKPHTKTSAAASVHFHFDSFPQSVAQKLFSQPILASSGGIILLALIAIALEPSIIPTWRAFFFPQNLTLSRLILMIMGWITMFFHEMAHLIAVRAFGLSARLGVSNRMWHVVAETDITSIWGLPRKQRFLPLLAGPLLDTVCAAALILLFFAQSRGWVLLPTRMTRWGQALLLLYLLQLLWQCYFFVRTDFYYVFANFFRCKSLMKDTEAFLRNQLARLIHSVRQVNQSHIPVSERRVIRIYTVIWLFGRTASIASLLFITIPLLWHYYMALSHILSAGFYANPYTFTDAVLMLFLVFAPQFLGFWLWIRSFRFFRS
ncbi:hypothetical protein NDI45_12200 [Leptolyngbya sp. GB1-A1]|uniref:hypothetical protein n=1 Tax=Leptolyngbya sp. GB1-A1 TaxID=2933908 RepID=UPI003296D87A